MKARLLEWVLVLGCLVMAYKCGWWAGRHQAIATFLEMHEKHFVTINKPSYDLLKDAADKGH